MNPLTIALLLSLTIGSGNFRGGGGHNVVVAHNMVSGRVSVAASLQVNRIPGQRAMPVNLASASSSCTDCGTLAVAVQLDLASSSARQLSPVNMASATNSACTRCVTVARAVQVFYTVDDPKEIPPSALATLRDLDAELRAIANDRSISMPDVLARVDGVIARFFVTAATFSDRSTEATSP